MSDAINRTFPPEFRNRLDAQVAFRGLEQESIRRVVDKFVLELNAQLGAREVSLEVTPELRDWLGNLGYRPEFGAREMGRVIQDELKKPLADELLFGRLMKGGSILADLDGEKVTFTIVSASAPVPVPPDLFPDGEPAGDGTRETEKAV